MNYEIRPPKTMRKEFENYLADRARLNTMMENGKLTLRDYKSSVKKLEAHFARKIDPADRLLFKNEAEFSNFMDYLTSKNPDNEKNLQWAFQHEREHYEALIIDPAIKAQYCFWVLREENGSVSGLPAIFAESLKDEHHYLQARKKSLHAITEASPGDKLEL